MDKGVGPSGRLTTLHTRERLSRLVGADISSVRVLSSTVSSSPPGCRVLSHLPTPAVAPGFITRMQIFVERLRNPGNSSTTRAANAFHTAPTIPSIFSRPVTRFSHPPFASARSSRIPFARASLLAFFSPASLQKAAERQDAGKVSV